MLSTASSTSKYKGVCWDKRNKKWGVTIQANKKKYHLGYFKDEIDAAKAYDKKAKKLHGQFACLNFPPVVIPTGTMRSIVKRRDLFKQKNSPK